LKPTNNSVSSAVESKNSDITSLYRLDLNYIGTEYFGFQSQPNGNTIQDHLEKALGILCRHPVRVTAASRTDTGVHAEHQVVTFKSPHDLKPHRLVNGLNALLPPTIRVAKACAVAGTFHPIFDCTGKIYRYQIWRSHGESSFLAQRSWKLITDLDIEAMRRASGCLLGEHDFTSFCAKDSSAKSKVRRLREIKIIERGPMLELWFLGDGFLKQMVRNIVGALVAVGRNRINEGRLREILEIRDRSKAPETAPADGLSLMLIFYGHDQGITALLEKEIKRYNLSLYSDWI
jgi:tRNA pseudouridine38-40 synthase